MNPSCYRCGAPVEEGTLFCKECGAPQIRVAIEPTPSAVPSPEPTAEVHSPALSQQQPSPRLHWTQTATATILAGLLEAFATMLGPLLFILGILAGGFFSVAVYQRRNPSATVTKSLGARLGLISGAIGFGIFAVLSSIELLVFKSGPAPRDLVMRQLEQTAAQYPTPEVQQFLQYLKSPEGWALIVALSTIFTVVAFLVLSTLGGMAGGAMLEKKNQDRF